ncbi:MAG: glycosyl transferase family 2 [Hyphomicrobiales bacterium]|nr:glycosyl transferase family 2 [Hyphomicrobiales bacterium]
MLSVPTIDVCICTYRRESVSDTLRSVAAQSGLPASTHVRIVVADNDETPSAESLLRGLADELGIDLLYVHAPARNISIARNACLDAATAPLVAFLDDDLIATPHWLTALVEKADATGADVVFGPVKASYPQGSPGWARAADLHSTLPTILPDDTIVTGYTCNVLMRSATVGPLRFKPELGRSGGEDTLFFHTLSRDGARFVFADEAIMREEVNPARINLKWLVKRSFRAGQTHARILRSNGERPVVAIPKLFLKAGFCFGLAALHVGSPPAWRQSLVRGALHVGALSSMIGARDLELY